MCYRNGIGVEQNKSQAIKFFNDAILCGDDKIKANAQAAMKSIRKLDLNGAFQGSIDKKVEKDVFGRTKAEIDELQKRLSREYSVNVL